jgi:HEAT repeat protein
MRLSWIGPLLLGCATAAAQAVGDPLSAAVADLAHPHGARRAAAAECLIAAGRPTVRFVLALLSDPTPAPAPSPPREPGAAQPASRDALHRHLQQPDELLADGWELAGDERVAPIAALDDLRNQRFVPRLCAAWLLGELGIADRAVLDALEQALAEDDQALRLQTLVALDKLAQREPAALAGVAGALGDPLAGSRAARILAAHGRNALPLLVAALQRSDDACRVHAARALGAMEPHWAMGASDALAAQLAAPQADVRSAAASALRRIGPTSVPALLGALASRSPMAREHAAATIVLLGPQARAAAGVAADRLEDADALVAQWCAQALGMMELRGPTALRAAAALRRAASCARLHVRAAAIEALGGLGDAAADTAPWLCSLVARGQERLPAIAACRALGRLRESALAVGAEAVLASAYRDTDLDAGVRTEALQALLRSGPSVVPAITALLAEVEPFEQDIEPPPAPLDFGAFGTAEQRSAAHLLGDQDPARRNAAARLLAQSDIADPAVLAALARAAGDDHAVATTALEALRRHAASSPTIVLPALVMVAGRPGDLQATALDHLAQIGAPALPAVPALREALRSPLAPVRSRAARALGKIGSRADAAIADLELAARDPVRYVAEHAASALERIRAR